MALKLNWKNTQLQPQPATAVSFSVAAENQLIVPDHIFPMMDGTPPVDVVRGAVFDTPVGVVDVDYSFGAPAYGLYDGTDHESNLSLEISSASGGVSCSDKNFLNPNHDSFGIYLHYRIVEGDSGATVSMIRKGGDHLTPSLGDVTFQLHYDETTHRIYLSLAYNTTDAGSFAVNAYVAGTVDDACHHWLYAKVNFTAKTLEVFGDTDAGTSTDLTTMIDAIEAEGERFSNPESLVEIGANSDLSANDNPTQLSYMAIFRGRASELFTQAVGDTLWKHGKCQNLVSPGVAITYARTSRVAYPIAADKVAMWSGSGGGGDVQVPLEFNEGWAGDDSLSLGCHPPTENLAGDANDLTAWTTSSATVDEATLVSERGLREMDVVNATANGGHVYHDFTGLTAATTYSVSWYARAATGSHSARVEVTQNDLSTTLTNLEPALTTTRSRNTFIFTTQGGQTQLRMKLFGGITTTQANTGYHGVMLTEGTAYGSVIYNDIDQDGTTETLAVQTQRLDVAGNAITSPDEGSLWASYVQSVRDTGAIRKICDIHSDVDNEDRRFMEVLAIGTQDSGTYNAAGASYQTTTAHAALTANSEYNRSLKWRRKANLAAGAYTLEDDITAPGALTQTVVGTANTEGTGGHTRIFIACNYSGTQQLSGLQSLHLYGCEVRAFNIVPAVVTATTVAASAFSSDPGISNGITDHGALSGRADDDHLQYLRTDGARASTGAQTFSAGVTIGGNTVTDILLSGDPVSTSDLAVVTAGYIDAQYAGTLDQAYDGPAGSGAGRSIIADSGAVVIDNTADDTTAILELRKSAVGSPGQAGTGLLIDMDDWAIGVALDIQMGGPAVATAIQWTKGRMISGTGGTQALPMYGFVQSLSSGTWYENNSIRMGFSNTEHIRLSATGFSVYQQTRIAPAVESGGAIEDLTVTSAAHTAQTVSTESPNILFDLSATKTWTSGALASQNAFKILAPTYDVGAFAITDAATVFIEAAPIAGGSSTITNPAALRIGSGQILHAFGTDANPAYGFSGSVGTGVNSPSTNLLDIVLGGSKRFQFASIQMRAINFGSAALPIFTANTGNTKGLFFDTDVVGLSTAGLEGLRIDASQNTILAGTVTTTGLVLGGHTITDVLISTDGASTSDTAFVTPGWIDVYFAGTHPDPHRLGAGSPTSPTYANDTVTNSGVYFAAGGAVAISVNGVQQAEFGEFTNSLTQATYVNSLQRPGLLVTIPASSGHVTVATGAVEFNFTGSIEASPITARRGVYFDTPSYSSPITVTVISGSTVYIAGAPIASTNVTFTDSFALEINNGGAKIRGGLELTQTNTGGTLGKLIDGVTPTLSNQGVTVWNPVTFDFRNLVNFTANGGAQAAGIRLLRPQFTSDTASSTMGSTYVATLHIDAAPLAGVNMSFGSTVPYAIWAGGRSYFSNVDVASELNVLGQAVHKSGSAALPAISPLVELDTGIYFPDIDGDGSQDIAFSVASTLVMHVDEDRVDIAVDLVHTGTNIGFYGTTAAAQSAAYTVTSPSISRSLNAPGSATTLNNNNILAGIIADLRNIGLLG